MERFHLEKFSKRKIRFSRKGKSGYISRRYDSISINDFQSDEWRSVKWILTERSKLSNST